MVDLRAGFLHLEGIDLVVPDLENLRTDRLAAVGLLPGAELTMTDCTVTLAVNRPGAALVVVQPEVAAASTPASGGTLRAERGHPSAGLLPSLRRRRGRRCGRPPNRPRAVQRPRRHRGKPAPRLRRRPARPRRLPRREVPPESSHRSHQGRARPPRQHARGARASIRVDPRRKHDPQHGQPRRPAVPARRPRSAR